MIEYLGIAAITMCTIALAVAFLMLMAPLEYVVIQRLRPQWLAFYRADEMFFPYFSAGISLGWMVCQARLPQ